MREVWEVNDFSLMYYQSSTCQAFFGHCRPGFSLHFNLTFFVPWVQVKISFTMGGFSKHVPPASNIHFDIDDYLNRICAPSQIHKFPTPIARFLGWRKQPAKPIGNIVIALYAFLGAFTGLIVVGATYRYSPVLKEDHIPVLYASLVSSSLIHLTAGS